jgi:hypothetical protein
VTAVHSWYVHWLAGRGGANNAMEARVGNTAWEVAHSRLDVRDAWGLVASRT